MGNRAVITTKKNFENNGIGVYVHWNGGYDSVSAFLKYCDMRGFRSPSDDCYGWASLCQVISNFFGSDGLSIGIDTINHLDCDNWDNGVYIIDGWNIVDRKFFKGTEQKVYDMEEMLLDIDNSQPEDHKMGEDYIKAKEVPVSELSVGDEVYMRDYNNKIHSGTIVGIGKENSVICGQNVGGVFYTDFYNKSNEPWKNIDNYLMGKTYKVKKFGETL